MTAPSGEQVEIALGDQQATVVEVGGGLRTYSVAGRELVDGYGIDEMSSSGRGQVLIPWPNRLEDGSYEFGGQTHQLPIDDVEERDAIHGLVRWVSWRPGEREPHRVVMEHLLHPRPGYPFSLALAIEYRLSEDGLGVTTTATNVGRVSCPFGSGAHPYLTLGTGTVDEIILRGTGGNGPAFRRARDPRRLGSCRGHGHRFPPADGDRRDEAGQRVHRPGAGRRRTRSRPASRPSRRGRIDPLGRRQLSLPDGVHRGPASRRRPARSRRRAHDLSAERVPQRHGPGPPRARPVVHRQVGHTSRLTPPSMRLKRPLVHDPTRDDNGRGLRDLEPGT